MQSSAPLLTGQQHLSRRTFFAQVAAAGAGVACLAAGRSSALAGQLKSSGKRVLLVFQHGGLSQLESWDPKPNTEFGGPFAAISTSVPGVHVSELLPESSRQLHHLALLRGLNTDDANHDS